MPESTPAPDAHPLPPPPERPPVPPRPKPEPAPRPPVHCDHVYHTAQALRAKGLGFVADFIMLVEGCHGYVPPVPPVQ